MEAVASAALCGEKQPPPSAFQLFYRSRRSVAVRPGRERRVADVGSRLWCSLLPPRWCRGVDKFSWAVGGGLVSTQGAAQGCLVADSGTPTVRRSPHSRQGRVPVTVGWAAGRTQFSPARAQLAVALVISDELWELLSHVRGFSVSSRCHRQQGKSPALSKSNTTSFRLVGGCEQSACLAVICKKLQAGF